MKAFVTGGSGFIGQRLVQRLVERGDTVYALARSERSAGILTKLGAIVVPGELTDVESMRHGMQGCDTLFHLASWYKVGSPDWNDAETINVGGTRKVLRLAMTLNISKIIYVSSVAVFGNTRGEQVDETYFSGGPFLTEYERTKWLAHYTVAAPLISKGAPMVIVMPGVVFGPGDQSLISDLMRWFYRGLPIFAGAETTLSFVHVDDVVEGIILAAEMGRIGESYILAGPAVPLGDMLDFWGHLSGRPTPSIRLPASFVRPLAPLLTTLQRFIPLPPLFTAEALYLLGGSYAARAEKARTELGWQTRPLQASMMETLQWIGQEEETLAQTPQFQQQRWAVVALISSLILLLLWLKGRRE